MKSLFTPVQCSLCGRKLRGVPLPWGGYQLLWGHKGPDGRRCDGDAFNDHEKAPA